MATIYDLNNDDKITWSCAPEFQNKFCKQRRGVTLKFLFISIFCSVRNLIHIYCGAGGRLTCFQYLKIKIYKFCVWKHTFCVNKILIIISCLYTIRRPTYVLKEITLISIKSYSFIFQVDIIVAAFVTSSATITELKGLFGEKGNKIAFVANIQTIEGFHNFDDILSVSSAEDRYQL